MTNSENGKGSKARPFSVSKEVFEENWNRIFCRIPKFDFELKRKHRRKRDSEHSLEEKIQSDLK
jgi:hypothetical protein